MATTNGNGARNGRPEARVLVVDDERSITDLVGLALRYEGFDVAVAATGREALTQAAAFAPDLVVLDVMLPDLNGLEVCSLLRAGGRLLPVVFLTARDATEDKVSALSIGGDDYVTNQGRCRAETVSGGVPGGTGPTSCGSPTSPSTRPARASCTAAWCWTCSAAAWSGGPSTPGNVRTWLPTPSGWPYDNAVVESFWARLQVELLNRQRWNTRVELANAIFEYIEGFHNRCRRHSALGWQTPLDFEQTYHRQLASPHS